MQYRYATYLSANMAASDCPKLLKFIDNPHELQGDISVESRRTGHFKSWLSQSVKKQPLVTKKILDDKYFVEELQRLKIIATIKLNIEENNNYSLLDAEGIATIRRTLFYKRIID